MPTIAERVRTAIASALHMESVEDGQNFYSDLGCDSLDLMDACMAIEDAVEVKFGAINLTKLRTVGDVVAESERLHAALVPTP